MGINNTAGRYLPGWICYCVCVFASFSMISEQNGEYSQAPQNLLPPSWLQVPQALQGIYSVCHNCIRYIVCLQVTQHKKSAESKNAQGRRRYSVVTDLVTLVMHRNMWIVTPCDAVTWRCSDPQVRPQAAGLRRPVQAHPEEEGQDHQEAGAQAGVHRV